MVIGKEQGALQLDKTHTKADVMCKLDCFPPSSTLFANLYWMFKRVFWNLKYLLHGQIYIFQVRSDKLEARRALRATSFRYPPYPLPPYLPTTTFQNPEHPPSNMAPFVRSCLRLRQCAHPGAWERYSGSRNHPIVINILNIVTLKNIHHLSWDFTGMANASNVAVSIVALMEVIKLY